MYKKILIMVILLLLVGCDSQNNEEIENKRYEDLKSELETQQTEFENMINQINDKLETKNRKIDNLTRRIVTLESENKEYKSNIEALIYQIDDMEYRLRLVTDIATELDDYTTIRGIITSYDEESSSIEIDVLEYIAYYDEERIKELDIDTENEAIISGAYIYNSPNDDRIYSLSEQLKIFLYETSDPGQFIKSTNEELISKISKSSYTLHLVDGLVIRITEDFHN